MILAALLLVTLAQPLTAAADNAVGKPEPVKVSVPASVANAKINKSATQSLSPTDANIVVTAPDLVSPFDGATLNWNVSYEFTWNSVLSADLYELQLPELDTSFYLETTPEMHPQVLWIPIQFGGEGSFTLHWRVRGYDNDGAGPWSEEWAFDLTSATAPPGVAPGLLTPLEREVFAPGETVVFSWSEVFNGSGYEIQIDQGEIVDRGASLEYAMSFETQGTHLWTARSYNHLGNGPWAATGSFVIEQNDIGDADTVRIGCPVMVEPAMAGDSFAVPINIWFDEYVYDVNLAFEYDNAIIEPTSVNLDNSIIPLSQREELFVGFNLQQEYFTISWFDPTLELPLNPFTGMEAQPLLSVNFRVLQDTVGVTRDIDTLVMGQSTRFDLMVDDTDIEPMPSQVIPQYVDCGMEDIIFPAEPMAPVFVNPPDNVCGTIIEVEINQPVQFAIEVIDSTTGDVVTLSALNVPLGASFNPMLPLKGNPAMSTFSWTPSPGQIGLHTVTIVAEDSIDLLSAQCELTFDVVDMYRPDPGSLDSVRIGCPLLVEDFMAGDSFALPIKLWHDENMAGFRIGLRYNQDFIEATSINFEDSPMSLEQQGLLMADFLPSLNQVGLTWESDMVDTDLEPTMASSAQPYFYVNFRILEGAAGGEVDIDTVTIEPDIDFHFFVENLEEFVTIRPRYRDCGEVDITFGDNAPICGDLNNDQVVDVADLDDLIDYLFFNGPAPSWETADVDECGSVNVVDAGYLSRFIYSLSAPAPCMADHDCLFQDGNHEVLLDCPISAQVGEVDSVALPVLVSTDSVINGFCLGFTYDSDYLDVTSVDLSGSVVPGGMTDFYFDLDTANNRVHLGWVSGGQQGTIGPVVSEQLCNLWFRVPPDAPEHQVNVDSISVPPVGEFMFSLFDGGGIRPKFIDCGFREIAVLPAIGTLEITDLDPPEVDTLMVDDSLRVTFNRVLNRSTVSSETFVIAAPGPVEVGGNRLFADGDSTVIFVPTDVFPPLTEVFLLLNGVEGIGGEAWPDEEIPGATWKTGHGVYPGDLNNDGVVSEQDINSIIQFWHETGPPRVNFATRWRIPKLQGAYAWPDLMGHYADGNGDGIVDETDLFPVGRHFGDTHPFGMPLLSISDDDLVADYRPQMTAFYDAIAGNQEPFMVRAQEHLARLLGRTPLPDKFTISQNYPNPFNPETTIKLQLPQGGMVTVEVFNARGQKVRTLISAMVEAGVREVHWDGRDERGAEVASGVYFYRVTSDQAVETRKMMLLR